MKTSPTTFILGGVLLGPLVGATVAQNTTSGSPPPTIKWSNCTDKDPPQLQCGRIEVPIDYGRPGAEKVTLTMARLKTNSTKRLGSLMWNPGGPGRPATQTVLDQASGVAKGFSAELMAQYDIIGLDPRGVGMSNPLKCNLTIWNQPYTMFPTTEAQFAQQKARNSAMSQSCRELTGPLMDHLDTLNVAKDFEMVRQALGEEKLNLLGHSYGTQIGTQYAELYPSKVGRFALDAMLDHSMSEQVSLVIDSLAVESVLGRFFDWCQVTAECVLRGQDIPAILKKVVDGAFEAKIRDKTCPPSPEPCKSIVTAEEFLRTVMGGLYFLEAGPGGPGWLSIAQTIKSAAEGDVSKIVATFGDARTLREVTGIAYACTDWRHDFKSLADLKLKADMLKVIAPHSRGVSAFLLWQTGCVGWDAKLSNPQKTLDATKLAMAPQMMMVNAQWDPVSYMVMATEVNLQVPNSVLAIRDGVGHGSYMLFGETSRAIDAFLLRGVLPKQGQVYAS